MFRLAKREHHRTAPSPLRLEAPGRRLQAARGHPRRHFIAVIPAILAFQRFLQAARRRR